MSEPDIHEVLRQTRGKVYGPDPEPGFRSLGRIWRGVLEDWFREELPGEIPPHIVANMMAALKISRASRPFPQEDRDSYNDARVYLNLAEDLNPMMPTRPENPEGDSDATADRSEDVHGTTTVPKTHTDSDAGSRTAGTNE